MDGEDILCACDEGDFSPEVGDRGYHLMMRGHYIQYCIRLPRTHRLKCFGHFYLQCEEVR